VRFFGFLFLFAAITTVLKPFQVFADFIPMIGNLVGRGLGFAAFLVAVPVTLATIAMGWIFYRPLLGLALLAGAVFVMVWLWRRSASRVAVPAGVVPPPPLPPTPPPAPVG
jgi:hypothetical protein